MRSAICEDRRVWARVFVAVLIALHAHCIAACSVSPCATGARSLSLPPCHRKHLPKNTRPLTDACSQGAVAAAVKADIGDTALLDSHPGILLELPGIPLVQLARVSAISPSPPQSRPLQLHLSFRI